MSKNLESTEKNKSQNVRAATADAHKSHHAVTIGKTPQELYTFWRNFENLSLFMKDVQSVRVLSPKTSHWTVQLKSGLKAEWDAQVTADVPGQMISWSSVEGSEVRTSGTVWFEKAPAKLGCVVRLTLDFHVPGGKLTEIITAFTGEDPDNLIRTNLRRLKGYLETGEIATVEGQPSGREDGATEVKVTH